MKIIKRNGSEADFNKSKIQTAIGKAGKDKNELSDEAILKIATLIEQYAEEIGRALSVEEVQDKVEDSLIHEDAPETAKAYIRYRYQKNLARESNTTDDQILSIVECANEEVNQENANKNPTVVSVQRDYIAGEVSKDISRRILLPPEVVKAHDEGLIHFHDADYFVTHSHNCFAYDTKFVTSKGVRDFNSCRDGEEVEVLTKNGDWAKATVRMYGKRDMNIVTLQSGRTIKEVRCTPDHRWVLKNGEVTTNLKVGDRLYCLNEMCAEPIDEEMFCFGMILGDGCDTHRYNEGVRIRLCGDKNRYVDMFKRQGFNTEFKFENGDICCEKHNSRYHKSEFMNGHIWRYLSHNQIYSLFLGYYAADGAKNTNKIATSKEEYSEMIQEISAVAGYHVSTIRDIYHDTPYKKDAHLIDITFCKSQIPQRNWIVKDIQPCVRELEAWCVEEPKTHTFTLDGGIVTGNCDLLNLEDMLQNGTVISGTKIDKPHSFATACNIATQIIAQVASCQYGGQSITLSHLAPFVDISRKKIRAQVFHELSMILAQEPSAEQIEKVVEARVKDEIEKGIQTIQYQVVTLMTTNGQAPFITVFMYLDEVPEGQTRDDLAMVIEAMLNQRIKGVKNEAGVYVSPAFPKLIYALDEDNIHPDSKYYYLTELAAKCTAKRLVPDYISAKKMRELKVDKNGNGNVYTCMGCRSFLTPYVDPLTNEPKYYGRFNQGVVTINLVDVACSTVEDNIAGMSRDEVMAKFWEILDNRLEICHTALRCRHERLKGTLSDVAPILWQHGALARLRPGESITPLLFGGYSTLSLGYAGLWECVYELTGKKLTEPDGERVGLKILEHLNAKFKEWKIAENIDYSLYGTPMESTTYKFAKALQKRFGKIKGVSDKNYITNSYHVHVTEEIDAFSKLALEAKFQALSPGGAISYVEVPDMQSNIPAVLDVMKFIYDTIMYAELNTKSDYCQVCGWDGEIEIVENEDGKLIWECPNCKNRDPRKMNVTRRVCGYLSSGNAFNQGRTQEIKERVLHL